MRRDGRDERWPGNRKRTRTQAATRGTFILRNKEQRTKPTSRNSAVATEAKGRHDHQTERQTEQHYQKVEINTGDYSDCQREAKIVLESGENAKKDLQD